MRTLLLFGFCALSACTPSANNTSREVAAPTLPLDETGNKDPEPPTPVPTPTSTATPVDPGATTPPPAPAEDLQIKGCNNIPAPGSAHPMSVQVDETTGAYKVDFINAADRQLQVISLYVTGKNDSIPIFPKFEFNGTAYWMVAVDDPFEEFFVLPVRYGSLPSKGIDVTANYKGLANGARLGTITVPTCLKFSVITFEPEEAESFKTSAFLQTYRP